MSIEVTSTNTYRLKDEGQGYIDVASHTIDCLHQTDIVTFRMGRRLDHGYYCNRCGLGPTEVFTMAPVEGSLGNTIVKIMCRSI